MFKQYAESEKTTEKAVRLILSELNEITTIVSCKLQLIVNHYFSKNGKQSAMCNMCFNSIL